jgi:hypothetical protein
VGHRTGMDDAEKRKFLTPLRLELQTLGRPARSLSLTPTALSRLDAWYRTNILTPSYTESSMYDAANLLESEVAKNISEKQTTDLTAARHRRTVKSLYNLI